MVRRGTEKDRNRINEYYSETGWQLSDDLEVIVVNTIEEVASFLKIETEGKSFEELEEIIDERGDVWFDGDETSLYYVLTLKE